MNEPTVIKPKLHLASFLQPENFGSGRLIGIVEGPRPRNIKIDLQFSHFTPKTKLLENYKQNKITGDDFVKEYKAQLETVFKEVNSIDELPFKDGDTLISWERAEYTNYRKILAPYLEKVGYEVVLN